jgi:hypothetical protein
MAFSATPTIPTVCAAAVGVSLVWLASNWTMPGTGPSRDLPPQQILGSVKLDAAVEAPRVPGPRLVASGCVRADTGDP